MMTALDIPLADESATVELGRRLSGLSGLIFLHGELGAGKTTLVRGFLRGLGHEGAVRSPTYTLIEPYDLGERRVFHLDIYRLSDPEELDFLGVRDELDNPLNTLLVEWPARACGELGQADIEIYLDYDGSARSARIEAISGQGDEQLRVISKAMPV